MTKRIYKSTFAMVIMTLILSLLIMTAFLYNYFEDRIYVRLSQSASYIIAAVEGEGESYFQRLDEGGDRVTYIAADGTVLYDNCTDVATMENHSDREEFSQAVSEGEGRSIRYSSTLSRKTLYYAKLLPDGSVIRVSATNSSVWALLAGMIQPIAITAAIAIGVAAIMGSGLSKRIMQPINSLDLEHPEKNSTPYEELTPLLTRLYKQSKQIEQQMEMQKQRHGAFTANISHELKTPLTSISGIAEIMENNMVKLEDIPHFAHRIHRESERLISLVSDIIKLSQLDEGQVAAKKEIIDLKDVAEDVRDRLKTAAEAAGVTVDVLGDGGLVEAVPQIAEDMIYNLVDNAIKYNKKDGRVDIEVKRVKDGVRLSVSDTGIGIDDSDRVHIFERFYRADKSRSKSVGGTGLGLSIVKHGAMYHNAELSVDSELGIGTTITVMWQPWE